MKLYYSTNGTDYIQWPGEFDVTPISFTVGDPGTYWFYTLGADTVGNEEPSATTICQTVVDTEGPPPPVVTPEPMHTQGTSNSIDWAAGTRLRGAPRRGDKYQADCYSDATFETLVSTSGWLPGLTHTFTDLDDGEPYWYRVKAKDNAGNESGWSIETVTSIQDASAPVTWVLCESLGAYQDTLAFDVPFAWTDDPDGSGLDYVKLYYSTNGTDYIQWPGEFDGSLISFTATVEDTYRFYTLGADTVGNEELAPASACTTVVDTEGPEATISTADCSAMNGGGTYWTEVKVQYGVEGEVSDVQVWYRESGTAKWSQSAWLTHEPGNTLTDAVTVPGVAVDLELAIIAKNAAQTEANPTELECTVGRANLSAAIDTCDQVLGGLEIEISWSGEAGVTYVELWYNLDNTDWNRDGTYGLTPNPFIFDVSALETGEYDLIVVGHNAHGNTEDDPETGDTSECTETVTE